MKRKLLVLLSVCMFSLTFTGCGKTTGQIDTTDEQKEEQADENSKVDEKSEKEDINDNATEAVAVDVEENVDETEPGEGELGDYPQNFMEERCGRYEFDYLSDIEEKLQTGEGYIRVKLYGSDNVVELISNELFLDGNNGFNAMSAYPYIEGADGKHRCAGVFASDSTATPIAISDDGMIYEAHHNDISVYCLGDNGTEEPALMVMKYLYVEYGEDGNPSNYGGFIRDKNTVVNNYGKQVEGDEAKKLFEQAFEAYEDCYKIAFTTIQEPITDPKDMLGVYVNYQAEKKNSSIEVTANYLVIDPEGNAALNGKSVDISDGKIDGTEYIAHVDNIIVGTDTNATVYECTDIDTSSFDYSDKVKKVAAIKSNAEPGYYWYKYPSEYEDGDIWLDYIIIDEDGYAITLVQDWGTGYKDIHNGINIGTDGQETEMFVGDGIIAVYDSEYDYCKVYTKTGVRLSAEFDDMNEYFESIRKELK